MSTITRNQLLDQLNWRYATKQFDPSKKISAEDWDTLEEALRLSASSVGLQPWKFLVVEDPELRATLQPVSYGQSQIVDASHLVVFTTKFNLSEADVDAHIAKTAEVRGISVEDLAPLRGMAVGGIIAGKSEEERRNWAFNQTYIALGNLLTSAALLGIDACPMEGFSREEYDRILGLTEQGLASAAVVTLGYRSSEDKYGNAPKVRFDRDEVILHL
ncbi:NAD(P)H-dependent oxidoreductase [Luteolibacter yonseiensis]|uniref:NAD(P)H-dependent oxidoreductase n=1 Tax=Luteolibacter yonseiensis TaxID=1144680 RepID=A0A934R1D4_9BACT|nr:NAD(P)H-dependent oxidoreductase [Luteolibacter yonseiensis]MBK1814546.1 NAD(P)H-dependent oxidoreductase [Luteolibacter yonseiensis]